jgi:hypothetical protein
VSELLARAFGALGDSPSYRELALVAEAVRESDDEEALEVLEAALEDGLRDSALDELALASGSSGFVALDLLTEFFTPGGSAPRRSRR